MKIDSSIIHLVSQQRSVVKDEMSESLRAWKGDRRPDFEGQSASPPAVIAVSRPNGTLLQAPLSAAAATSSAPPIDDDGLDPMIRVLKTLLEKLLGHKIKMLSLKDLQRAVKSPNVQDPNAAQSSAASSAPARAGYGVEYDYHASHYEAEQTSFSAEGVVKTADGKEIKFAMNIQMSREYYQEVNEHIRLGDAARPTQDPLVIDFGGTAAQLTDKKFAFDLNSDGTAENISFTGPGSGFLAFDRNSDGAINDGRELFGASSGNGFSELATYDKDGNGWIDESDPIFTALKVWTKDGEGQDLLSSLAEKNVGAIYLGSTSTPFDIKTQQNDELGKVRSTGIFLGEDGSVGSIQQIDLAV